MISPTFFLTGIEFDSHFENLKGTMILASKSFLSSFTIKGNKTRFTLFILCFKGFWSSLMDIVCCIMLVSYAFRSSYPQANTLEYYFSESMHFCFSLGGKGLDNFTIFRLLSVPILQSSNLAPTSSILGFFPHH